jgi:NitT/TauT family transport system permease protein
MVLFGIGEGSKVMVIAAAVFFPVLINAMAGVRQIQPAHIEIAVNYGSGRLNVLRHVILPAALPLVLAGIRQATNVALLVAIAVEMTAPDTGLGALVWVSWQVLRVERLYATLVIIALLGVALNGGLEWIGRRYAAWMPDREATI